jgi:hypothetical protein
MLWIVGCPALDLTGSFAVTVSYSNDSLPYGFQFNDIAQCLETVPILLLDLT